MPSRKLSTAYSYTYAYLVAPIKQTNSATMAPTYSITFINNSNQTGHVCICPNLQAGETPYGLIWLTQLVNPGTRATFVWPLQLSFYWKKSNDQPGHAISTSQTLPVDGDNNQVTLSKVNGAYMFGTPQPGPQPNNIYILTDNTVVPNEVTIGLGIAQSGIMAMTAQPNVTYSFAPFHPGNMYRLAFGQFETGQPLSEANFSLSTAITFPINLYNLTVALNLDHTWSIVPS